MTDQHANAYTLVSFRNSQGTEARGTLLKLARTTVVFEVYNPYSIVQLSEVLQEFSIQYGDRLVYNGRAVVSNLVNTGLMLVVSVTLVDPWSDLTDILNDAPRLREEVNKFIDDWQSAHQLRPGYQLAVGEIRSFLAEFSRWLEQVDIVTNNNDERTDTPTLSQELFKELIGPVIPVGNKLFQRFEKEASLVSKDELITHKAFVQRDLHPLIMRAPFIHRAFYKPLGYAGDYEMVNMMLRESREGPTTYTELINTLNLQMGPAVAHRNRVDILLDRLSQAAADAKQQNRPLHILNIGCGPAIEIQRFILAQPYAENCQFSLLDFNKETLEYTKKKINECMNESGRHLKLEFILQSVHELLKQATKINQTSAQEKYDFVYCAGLFDYLSDRVCSRLIQLFFRWTNPQGLVLTTNVHSNNPAIHWMEHVLEWYLIYRDEQQMLNLAPQLGVQNVYTDQTGFNVLLEITKTSATQ